MKIQEICFILFIFYISGISALLGLSFHKWGYINVVINRFKRIFRILHWLPRTVEWESSQILYLILESVETLFVSFSEGRHSSEAICLSRAWLPSVAVWEESSCHLTPMPVTKSCDSAGTGD